ncbi:helix-turn-helix domain-containing protein [Pseudomonas sp. F01002]|uniref:AraC-like ligand-binding domain-containing protein n=1 Tax=Pseudomonas sp. F01002 TaxID=2555724 RepID=UPI00106BE5AD|nr:helix-turn-helix domain-containing protein [Pseudomonas sp. F01002]TFB42735.1 helix-turn-helix domain-containing protein [Pseudomonas sp. F01002]
MNCVITTEGLQDDVRMDYWQHVVRENFIHFDMRPIAGQPAFNGKIFQHTRNVIQLAEVIADGHFVHRSMQHLSTGNDDFFLLLIQRHGTTQIEQDNRQVTMNPGDMVLCDSSRSYSMNMPGAFHHKVLMIPGRVMRHSLRNARDYTARVIPTSSGTGRLFSQFINSLQGCVGELDELSSSSVASATVELLCAALVGVHEQVAVLPGNLKQFHLRRLRAYVHEHLADQELDVERISKALSLSKRHLHALCDGQPNTLSSWIWKERLDAARRSLSDPANAQTPITEIALSVGFKSPAHFSRMFQSVFQMTPRDLRAQAFEQRQNQVEGKGDGQR